MRVDLMRWVGLLLTLSIQFAAAQPFPAKPITILVPAAAGGPSDTVARVVGQAMAKELKATVIIENARGAGATIGAARVARSPARAYTLILNHSSPATT